MAHADDGDQHAWFPVSWLRLLRKERAVLAVAASISSFMDRDGRAWPSRSAIAQRAGIDDPRAVTKAIARIRALAVIEIEDRRGRSTIYSMPKPSVAATLGNGDPGSSRPSTLGNGDPGTLGNGYRAERSKERNQRTYARGNRKKETTAPARRADTAAVDVEQEPTVEFIAAIEALGFNGEAKERAGRILRRVAHLGDLLLLWLREAHGQGLRGDEALAMAERRTIRGDRPEDGAEHG
jgi:hypothetical protein